MANGLGDVPNCEVDRVGRLVMKQSHLSLLDDTMIGIIVAPGFSASTAFYT